MKNFTDIMTSKMCSGPPPFFSSIPPCFPAPVVMWHDGLMANVLLPLTPNAFWYLFNRTTGRITGRQGRKEQQGSDDGRRWWEVRGDRVMCVWGRHVLFETLVVLWPGFRKVKAFPAHCTSEEITSVTLCHSQKLLCKYRYYASFTVKPTSGFIDISFMDHLT